MPSVLIVQDWITTREAARLRGLWDRQHVETGHIPPGSAAGTLPVIDHMEKYRRDRILDPDSRLSTILMQRFANVACSLTGAELVDIEGFRVGQYPIGGHFAAHRDTDSPDLASREWSLVCMLSQPDEYEGGELIFPELNLSAKLKKNAAIFFRAELLHGVSVVTSGSRFSLISFSRKS